MFYSSVGHTVERTNQRGYNIAGVLLAFIVWIVIMFMYGLIKTNPRMGIYKYLRVTEFVVIGVINNFVTALCLLVIRNSIPNTVCCYANS